MGSGSINAMNATIKYNRGLLRSVQTKKRSLRIRSLQRSVSSGGYVFPAAKPWLNKSIRENLQRENRIAAIKLWVTMALFVSVFVYFLIEIL